MASPTPAGPTKAKTGEWLKLGALIIATVISIISLVVSTSSSCREERHYNELTKPHAQLEEVRDKLQILNSTVDQCQNYVNSLLSNGNFTDEWTTLQWELDTIQYLHSKAKEAYIKGLYDEADSYISQAYTWINIVQPTSVTIPIPGNETIDINSLLGNSGFGIDETTTITTEEGEPLYLITASAYVEEPTGVPSSAFNPYKIIVTCELTPYGARFNHPISWTLSYNPAFIPNGFLETDLFIVMWDRDCKTPTILPTLVDLEKQTLTTIIDHLATYSIFAPPAN
jgi:hypothetical protein